MIMTINPIGSCIQDFEILGKIGSGGFAAVYKAKCRREGFEDTHVAIKMINQNAVKERNLDSRVKSEILIHSNLSHPSIVKFYTSFKDRDFVYLVLELCERGSLEEYIKCNGPLPEKDGCVLIKEIIDGIRYLHSQHILHRDLSLRNILLTDNMHIKIADFGMAAELKYPDEKKCTMLGTANFMSPEVVRKEPYDSKADCWSVGCILYALLYGTPPFDGKGKKYTEIMNAAVMSCLTFPDYASREAKDLLSHMLEKDPNKRINIHKALRYPFFQKYNTSSNTKSESSQRSGDSGVSSSSSAALSSRSTFKTYSTDDNVVHSWGTDWKEKNRYSSSVPNNLHRLCSDKLPSYHYDHSNSASKYSCEQEGHIPRQRRQRSKSPNHQSNEKSRSVNQLKNKIQCLPSRQDMRPVPPSHSNPLYPNRVQRSFDGKPGWQQMNTHHNKSSMNPYTVSSYPHIYAGDGSESQFHIRNHSESPAPYPACLQDICDDHYSQSYYSVHNSVDPNICNGTVYRDNKEMPSANYPDYPPVYSSCSHDQYCAAEKACSHDMMCCCRCHHAASSKTRSNSYHSHNSCEKEDRNGVDLILKKNLEVTKSLKDVTEPLTTKRLSPKRLATKDLIASILDNGEVCLEFLKSKRNKKYISKVCCVSGDGLTILLYKPKKSMLPTDEPPRLPNTMQGVQYFTFENLPETHWNKYHCAKRFVEIVRAKTPKVTVYGKDAKCIMMENMPNPDYEVHFYDGFQITQDRKKCTITDQNGIRTDVTNEDYRMQYFDENNLTYKWDEFIKIKNKCARLEENLKIFEENEDDSCFPIIIGRRPNGLLISYDVSKENVTPRSLHSSTLNRVLSGVKSSTMNSSMCNRIQKS